MSSSPLGCDFVTSLLQYEGSLDARSDPRDQP